MKFIVIFGPPAVGKMSVGQELAKLTGLKLFHNHMTIEMVLNLFPFGEPPFHKLVGEFRRRVFEEVAASPHNNRYVQILTLIHVASRVFSFTPGFSLVC